MFRNNVLYAFITVYYLCSISKSNVVALELDCNQYNNDLDILRQFPFAVELRVWEKNYMNHQKSAAQLSEDGTSVEKIAIKRENLVPSSLFCLSKLTELQIESTRFEDDIVPDALANLKSLEYLVMQFVPIKRLTKQLATLTHLEYIAFFQCSLTHLPDLDNLPHLKFLNLPNNHLTCIGESSNSSLEILDIMGNNFTTIPILKNKESLKVFFLNDNPLKNAEPIVLYPNLNRIHLYNTTLTSIPSNIDQLQQLEVLLLNDNRLIELPPGIFNLRKLYFLNILNNLFSPKSTELVREGFQKNGLMPAIAF